VVNPESYDVRCNGESIQLTLSEYKLLLTLVQNRGRVLTRDQLIDNVQGQGVTVVDRAIDTHIFGLRKKLGSCADLVETVRGVGYRVKTEI
jgi:two-component system phosphate regulon response regulator PhoB